jgi:radical SAM protein with 4Fe4S-binding SPASM domain
MNNNDYPIESYTVGLGLTDRCTAQCPHCYSRPTNDYHELDFDQILRLVETVPVKSINFGTGESILYPRFMDLVRLLTDRQIPVAVTTNGATVRNISDSELRLFHDVDFSLDFPQAELNDHWRGIGSFQAVMEGIARCRDQGVEASLVTCLMHENSSQMGPLAALAADLGVNLRVNIYKPVLSPQHQPTYEQFWQAIADLANAAYFIACSEPIVNAAIHNERGCHGFPCGRSSFRVHPDGRIVSCVYLNHTEVTLANLMADFQTESKRLQATVHLSLPEICLTCEYATVCAGGCASRRILGNRHQPDEYCFKVRGDRPAINARWKESKDLVHENYLCTMIFSG